MACPRAPRLAATAAEFESLHMSRPKLLRLLLIGLVAAGAALALMAAGQVSAERAGLPAGQAAPLHPTFALLDANGANVLDSGGPVSTLQTCGQCHDTAYIAEHNFHADLGLADFGSPGEAGTGRAWDASTGQFGQWNALTYRYLSAVGDERLDLGTADWVRLFSARHVGGGPAATSRDGLPLNGLVADASNPETAVLDPATGQPAAWDWKQSGTVELNCFMCHLAQPNNTARLDAIAEGDFRWASTATLLGTGLVTGAGAEWQWNPAAFDAAGTLAPGFVTVQAPTDANCAQCHGVVHTSAAAPLVVAGCGLENWQTATTGQVIAPEKIAASGLNLAGKNDLSRAWDVHAERGLTCTDCHYALNNPAQYQSSLEARPDHLTYDPRRLDPGEYLLRPNHNLARSASAQSVGAAEAGDTMRGCADCHSAETAHPDLPYLARHMSALACETCHVPQLYAPAIQQADWTVLTTAAEPAQTCRGVEGDSGTPADLVTGYQPVLLLRETAEGGSALAPYNLVTAWYWIYDDAQGQTRPVPLASLEAAWLEAGQYHPDILAAFDADGSGAIEASELVLDTPAKQRLIAGRLRDLGLGNPRIAGEVQPYGVNHNVTRGEWVLTECSACHSAESRITQRMLLAAVVPGGVLPEFVAQGNAVASGDLYTQAGALYYRPVTQSQDLYVFGHDRVGWVDGLGIVAFVGVLLGVGTHGGLRFFAALRRPRGTARVQRVYMYAVYERFWHWLQTGAILLLIATGLIIHRPDVFGAFSFRHVVAVHNVLAAILVINAALSLFYHLASGEIRQYLPRPYGFFDQAIVQARYYLNGIFHGGAHPFEKSARKKLNPLQQITYFGILNVLLPAQVITGALMWGAQHWPQLANLLGGLPVLAPLHSLIAWLFAAFIVAHVYLTTTGHTALAGIQAMIDGWDTLETHAPPALPVQEAVPDDDVDTRRDAARPQSAPEPEGAAF
jgi:thiosulfate reductase cytochrome b subunit